jgi:(p)ppGpp synthase/HD superfamily hydrolase
MSINMKRMNVTADQGVFSCDLDVLISDAKVVTNLCRGIKKIKGVNSASRMS